MEEERVRQEAAAKKRAQDATKKTISDKREISLMKIVRHPNVTACTSDEIDREIRAVSGQDNRDWKRNFIATAREDDKNHMSKHKMYPVPQRAATKGRSEDYFGRWVKQRIITRTGPSGQMTWIRNGTNCLDATNITEAINASMEEQLYTLSRAADQIHWISNETPYGVMKFLQIAKKYAGNCRIVSLQRMCLKFVMKRNEQKRQREQDLDKNAYDKMKSSAKRIKTDELPSKLDTKHETTNAAEEADKK
ncbi:hypothetical protein ACFE04_007621 [Oxalis oulophora]